MPIFTIEFSRFFTIQKYYDFCEDVYLWRFWIIGFYFSLKIFNINNK